MSKAIEQATRVRVQLELVDPVQALALAQLVKRAGFNDVRALASCNEEAYAMLSALDRVRDGLADAGYAPR